MKEIKPDNIKVSVYTIEDVFHIAINVYINKKDKEPKLSIDIQPPIMFFQLKYEEALEQLRKWTWYALNIEDTNRNVKMVFTKKEKQDVLNKMVATIDIYLNALNQKENKQ